MAAIAHNAKLNELVVDLGRSLLQYAAESSPWAKTGALADEMERLAARQRESVAKLVDLLDSRGWVVDFGVYPTDYGDLHFLGWNYFVPKLRASQDALVAELDEAVHTCVDDPEAVELLREILTEERSVNAALGALSTPPLPVATT
ncbi:MAG TPA: hypothetical protein VFG20_15225 [Planctomycetaceae bacterium]|nr:hypothetical protein [Planctomycetaceae bacterium]